MTSVSDLFTRSARRYDLMVGANPGYHRHLDLAARRLTHHTILENVLDLGCGTGASTRALLRAAPRAHVRGVDASSGMLERARATAWPSGQVDFVHGSAGDPRAMAGDRPFDACLATYLLRNIPSEERTEILAAVGKQLRPGGVLALQDYSVASSRRARALWDLVCLLVIIPLGALAQHDTRLYQYLWRSARSMEPTEAWCTRLRNAGFEPLEVHKGRGWQRGILHTVIAVRR